jgi:hypothetical protein
MLPSNGENPLNSTADPRYIGQPDNVNGGDITLTVNVKLTDTGSHGVCGSHRDKWAGRLLKRKMKLSMPVEGRRTHLHVDVWHPLSPLS